MRRKVTPAGTGVALFTAGLCMLLTGVRIDYPELVSLGGAALAAVLAALAWAFAKPDVKVSRTLRPGRVVEGGSTLVFLRVANRSRRPSLPLELTEQFARQRIPVPVPRLSVGEAVDLPPYKLCTPTRGVYTLQSIFIRHTDPLKLLRVDQDCATATQLYVHPRTYPARPLSTGGPRDHDGTTSSARLAEGATFHGLRNYVHGDRQRLIHWPSSARIGRLVVRQLVVPDQPRHVVMLDTSRTPYTAESFEDAVRVAASVCRGAAAAECDVELRTSGGRQATLDGGHPAIAACLDLLAGVTYGDDDGLRALIRLRDGDAAALVIVTGEVADDALPSVGAMSSRFDIVVLIRLTHSTAGPGRQVPGVLTIDARTAEEFAKSWNRATGR